MFQPGTLLGGSPPLIQKPIGEAVHEPDRVHLQPSLIPKEVKVEKPLTFSGKHSELNNFLFVMQQYIDTVALGTGSSACRFLTSYLRDDALTWWRSYSDDNLAIFD